MQWYGEIAEATEELKSDIRRMQEQQLRPIDFGLRVKQKSEELSITAAMKMRSAQMITEYLSFTGTLLETPYVSNVGNDNCRNLDAVSDILLRNHQIENFGRKKVIRDVARNEISDLLRRLVISPYNTKFPIPNFLAFIGDKTALEHWDICFPEGAGEDFRPRNCDTTFHLVRRTIYTSSEERRRIAIGQRGKVGGTEDGKVCIDDNELITRAEEQARANFEREHPHEEWRGNCPSNTWFRFIQNRRPLLLIYFIEPLAPEQDSNNYINRVVDGFRNTHQPLVCFALGVPTDGRDESQTVTYAANRIYTAAEQSQMADDNDNWEED